MQVPDFADAFCCEDAFMRVARERLVGASRRERNELAGTVMACAAADASEFVWESAV